MTYPYFPASLGRVGVYCWNKKPIVYKCGPFSDGKVDYNRTTEEYSLKCSIVNVQCSSDGQRFLDAGNPDRYNVCYYNNTSNRYETTSMNCPPKLTYNAKQNDCLAKEGLAFDELTDALSPIKKVEDDLKMIIESLCGIAGGDLPFCS